MLKPINAVQQAFWDTLVHKTEGRQLDLLSRYYGFPRYRTWPQQSWRKGLHTVAFGPRGIAQNVLAMIQAIFSHSETKNYGSLTAGDGSLNKDTTDGESKFGTTTWNDAIVGRWVEIKARKNKAAQYTDPQPDDVPEGIYQIVKKVSSTQIKVCPIKSTWWKSEVDLGNTSYSHKIEVNVLPFKIRERTPGPVGVPVDVDAITSGTVHGDGKLTPEGTPGIVEVLLYADDIPELKAPPGTYMQDRTNLTTAAGARYYDTASSSFVAAPNTPVGGQIQSNAFETGSQIVGPYPIYLGGDTIPYGLTEIFNLMLAAGIQFHLIEAVEGEV